MLQQSPELQPGAFSTLGLAGPCRLPTVLKCIISDLACSRGRNSRLYWSVRLLSALHAFEEILHVRNGAVTIAVFAQHGILIPLHSLAMHGEAAAIDLQCRVAPAEFKSSIIDGRIHHAFVHHIEARIAERRLNRIWTVPLLERVFVRQHERMFGLIRLHGPVHNVNPVREQIGHCATAKVPEPAPVMEFLFVKSLVGSGPEPLLPVQRLYFKRFLRPIPSVVLPPVSPHLHNAAQASSLNQINCVTEMCPAALLHA